MKKVRVIQRGLLFIVQQMFWSSRNISGSWKDILTTPNINDAKTKADELYGNENIVYDPSKRK